MEILEFKKPKDDAKEEAANKELLEISTDFHSKVLNGTIKGFAIVSIDKDGSASWWQSWPSHNIFEAYGLINRLRDVFSKEYWK